MQKGHPMKSATLKSWLLASFLVAASLFAATKSVLADTYQVILLYGDDVQFYGMDDSGTVVLNFSPFCSQSCYRTYVDGVNVGGLSPMPPDLVYDNGTPCFPGVPPGGSVIHGVCNNGLSAFTGFVSSGPLRPSVYVGSFSDISFLAPGGDSFIYMNGEGDVVFDDVFTENWYLALDTTTDIPEPSGIILLGTGMLAALGLIRRRNRQ